MCGICGVVDFSGRPVQAELVRRMARVIAHRGPDGEGVVVDAADVPQAALGARRLAIIDIEAGRQPIGNEDGTVWVTYNGEIYNFPELQAQLEGLGHRFRTHCDTEVVVHAYEEWGDDCVARFNGMFAFGVWDQRRRRLLLARDRLGVKPLAYVQRGDRLWFASEVKSLLEDPEIPRALDPDALLGYLAFFAVPEPLGLLRGVRKLPAGHVMVFDAGGARIRRYWDTEYGPAAPRPEAAWLEELEALLEDAVRIRLMSEVPLGAFLSSGVDSGLVVAMMARAAERVTTVNIAFTPGYDEAEGARAVARRFGTRHHEHVVTADMAWQHLRTMVWHHDEPSQSLIQGYFVSRAAREHVTVTLSGLGGDELFSGYPSHRAAQRFRTVDRVPRAVWRAARLVAGSLGGAGARRIARFSESALMAPDERFSTRYLQATDAAARDRLLSPAVRAAADPDGPSDYLRARFADCGAHDFLDRVLYVDQKTYLANELLRTADSMSMAHSLEVRLPLLDYRLVELAARVPPSLKTRGGANKRALRTLADRLLPSGAARRGKRGFTVPLAGWLSDGAEPFVRDTLSPDAVRRRGLFDPAEVQRIVAAHFAGGDHAHQLLALLSLELWHQLFLEAPG